MTDSSMVSFAFLSILHWDRAKASGPTRFEGKGVRLPSTGAVFCSDTFAPTASGRFLTFMWSYPSTCAKVEHADPAKSLFAPCALLF